MGWSAPPPPGLDAVCLWGAEAASDGPDLIVPDGCADLVWAGGRLVLAGPDTVPRPRPALDGLVAGVRLRPWVAGPLLGVAMGELVGGAMEVEDPRLLDALWRAPDSAGAAALLAAWARRRDVGVPDALVDGAGALVRQRRGQIRVGELAVAIGTGRRRLHRRFAAAVGYGPQTYARVVRLQHALRALERPGATAAGVAFAAGFADQAHLTRELRVLAGTTPGAQLSHRFKTGVVASTT